MVMAARSLDERDTARAWGSAARTQSARPVRRRFAGDRPSAPVTPKMGDSVSASAYMEAQPRSVFCAQSLETMPDRDGKTPVDRVACPTAVSFTAWAWVAPVKREAWA